MVVVLLIFNWFCRSKKSADHEDYYSTLFMSMNPPGYDFGYVNFQVYELSGISGIMVVVLLIFNWFCRSKKSADHEDYYSTLFMSMNPPGYDFRYVNFQVYELSGICIFGNTNSWVYALSVLLYPTIIE